jgi:YggT family protein
MRALLDVLLVVLQLYTYVIIAAVILSWLVAFNAVNRHNDVVRSIWNLVTALTEPLLRRIRGTVPNLGGIDISVNGGDKMCQMAARYCTSRVKRKGL